MEINDILQNNIHIVIYFIAVVFISFACWKMYKDGTGWKLYKLFKMIKEIKPETQDTASENERKVLEPEKRGILYFLPMIGALLFIAGTMRFILFSFPIIYIFFFGIGIFTSYIESKRKGRLAWESLIFPIGLILGGIFPFFIKTKEFYYVFLGIGLVIMFSSVILIEVLKYFKNRKDKHSEI